MSEVILTTEGKKQLEERLEYLKVTGRSEMAEKIRAAREFGDISENAEYDIAKEEQVKLEAEIEEIEQKLSKAKIIDENKVKTDSVSLGCTVRILDYDDGNRECDYKLVGTAESNPLENKLSNECPVGRAILGKKKGEEVFVDTMAGKIRLKILKIS